MKRQHVVNLFLLLLIILMMLLVGKEVLAVFKEALKECGKDCIILN